MKDIIVTCEDHTGIQSTSVGNVTVYFNQYKVIVNGNLAGYVGKGPGQSVKMIAKDVPLQIREWISEEVARILEQPVLPTVQSAVIPDENIEVEDDDGFEPEDF